MKKIFAMILTIAMLMTAIAAIAEGQGGPMGGPQQGQMQQGPQQGDRGQQPPEKPSEDQAPADGQQPPEKPADGQMPDLLSDLLSAGVITQAEYEALTAAQTAA